MTSPRSRIAWIVALAAAFLVAGTVPAGAHVHPTPTERAAPAVVYVEARAEVQVALVEHRQSDPGGVHIAIIQSTSNPVLATASGFVVDPTGVIVTSGALTAPDLDRARTYAVNEAFRKQYGNAAPLPGDLFTQQQIGDPTNLLQQRLEACYSPNRTNDSGGCVVTATPNYVVYPYVTSQELYGQSPAELLKGSTPDVAVLRVRGASGMPTVPLAESTAGARALSVLGFTGIPGELQAVYSHLAEVGGSTLLTEGLKPDETADAAKLAAGLRAGMRGGPVVAEDGQVIGFLQPEANSGPPPATAGRLVDARAIRDVLSAQKITPRRGPADSSFEAAMHAYKNGGFAAAIPNFQATLDVFPGHAMAANDLAVSQQNVASGAPGPATPAGGGQATTSAAGSPGGFPWTVVLLAIAAVLVLAGVAALVLRRRQASAAGGTTPSPGTPRPREGQPAAPSRPGAGGHERQAAPSVAGGSRAGAVAVIEESGAGRGGAASPSRAGPTHTGSAPSTSIPRQGPAAAVGDGTKGPSRASAAPKPAPSSRRDASHEPAGEDGPAYCTSCGTHLAPHYRYCPRCGGATG
ncbi:MAG: zinc ribbon protein [Modestobacter sp.]|nr:zinc ribbon protein [Modestobacter sp.]